MESVNQNIEIFVEDTPNPNALKFIVQKPVKLEGKSTFKKADVCELPLARDILGIPSINQVHLYENVITVSQDGDQSWVELVPQIEAVIQTRLPSHNPNFQDGTPIKKIRDDLPPDLRNIEEILNRTIRPGLRSDGGDIEVVDYAAGLLTVRFEGACGGCPSSTRGTLMAIEGILQQEFNPDIQIRLA